MKQLLFFGCAAFLMAIYGCNKYTDGGNFSLRSKKERLCNKWKVEKAYASEYSLTPEVGDNVTYDWISTTIEFKTDGSYEIVDYSPDSAFITVETGKWEFYNKKGGIITTGNELLMDTETGVVYDDDYKEVYWDIARLKETDLHIWCGYSIYQPKELYYELEPA